MGGKSIVFENTHDPATFESENKMFQLDNTFQRSNKLNNGMVQVIDVD